MNIKAILAGGPPVILALGGGVMYAQHELHYLLRPSVVETLAGVGAVGGAILWSMGKGKRKVKAEAVDQAPAVESVDERIARLAEAMERQAQALPPARGQVVDFTAPANARQIKRV
jgi:hypothetical protein